MARILVIDESQKRAVDICSGLIQAGHQVAAVLPSAQELIERIEEIKPDIILIETESPSRDTLEHLAVMNRDMPRPVVMFSQDGDSGTIRSAIQAGVAAYVVDGFDIGRLKPVVDVAVARFDEHQSMKRELADAGRKLSERKAHRQGQGHPDEKPRPRRGCRLRRLAQTGDGAVAAARKVAANLVDMARLLL